MLRTVNNFIFNLLFIFVATSFFSISQIINSFLRDTTSRQNYFNTSFDKQLNTVQLINSLDLRKNILSGDLSLRHIYAGNLLIGQENSYRDDETFFLSYSKPMSSSFSLVFESNFLLSSDSRNIGLNEAERMNSNFGILYFLGSNVNFLAALGLEKNKQLNIISNGFHHQLKLHLNKVNLGNFFFNAQSSYEAVKLQTKRIYSDFLFDTKLLGKFDDTNSLQFDLSYKNLIRDFIAFPFISDDFFEKRQESRFSPFLKLTYSPVEKFFTNFFVFFSLYSLSKSMNKFEPNDQLSALKRSLYEEQISLVFNLSYNGFFFQPLVGFAYNYRNEKNQVDEIFPIDEVLLSNYKQFESQRNNFQSRLNLFANSKFTLFQGDTLTFIADFGIFRYDTPSKQNVDDRDEFSSRILIINSLRFSKFLLFHTELDYNNYHLVFLNSQRSLINNWNHILRLSFRTIYQTNFFKFNPSFEILSNYTIYDFEKKGYSIQNYLFRQIQFRDSSFVFLSTRYSLETQISLRLLERGILFWKNFAMSKETQISEIFGRFLLFSQLNRSVQLGIGWRFYNIVQIPYSRTLFVDEYKFYSFSPETEVRISLGEDKSIFLQGWYELKFFNRRIISKISNIIVKISYRI
ncbi:MAG: hypothetical protein ACUVQ1_04350 [Candidatus Kapaibacteriales bacterium]